MSDLIKIVVTDSAGIEHEFPEQTGEVENHFERHVYDDDENKSAGWIRITTRTFTNKKCFDTETQANFYDPRRVDLIFGEYE